MMNDPVQQRLRVGVCGLGAMGRGMVKNLIAAGFEVHGYDIVPSLVERFSKDGGKAATSPKEVASQVDILLVIVVNSVQVSSVLFDADTGRSNFITQSNCSMYFSGHDSRSEMALEPRSVENSVVLSFGKGGAMAV